MAGILGIEIGSSNIKLVEVKKKGATLVVQKFSLLNTPEDAISNGVISKMEPIQKVITQALKENKYRARKTVAVVQSNAIIIRNAVMEKQPEKVIRQLLELKGEDYLPISQGQYQIDFKILREIEEKETVKEELLLVAAPNAIIFPIANLIKNLKLVPVQISIPSEAVESVFGGRNRMVYDSPEGVLVLDIGGKNTTVTIICQGRAILTRTIEFGVSSISEVLEKAYEKPSDSEEQDKYLSELIRPQIEYNIISEIERILQFYYSNYNMGNIKKIYLIGGGANIKGLRAYMRDALNIPTEKFNAFNTVIERQGIEFESYSRFYVNILGAINGL